MGKIIKTFSCNNLRIDYILTMENMMNDELHNYEPTCEELYPADFNHSEYKQWLDSTHTEES